jgi:exodeoxyribonuclease VII large subunit
MDLIFSFNDLITRLYFIIMENLIENSQEIISVSEVNNKAKRLLESELSKIWIEGEISSFTPHSSGHWYFSIKDEKSSLSCVMWSSDNNKILFKPQVGDKLIINGAISLYSPTGRYQLNAKHMELAGEGALLRAYEQLKAQLESEGLFSLETKKSLPLLPKKIAVITSSDGAVLQDIINVLGRRAPSVELLLIQTSVQGENASSEICKAISKIPSVNNLDALIIARGGGSIEDLWAFNKEEVARAIHALKIPVISAVGHETDFTIADFVADVRAPTPSAAAEIISQNHSNLDNSLKDTEIQLVEKINFIVNSKIQELRSLKKRIRHPGDKVRELFQKIDNFETSMKSSMTKDLVQSHSKLDLLSSKLLRFSPSLQLQEANHNLVAKIQRLTRVTSEVLNNKISSLLKLTSTLDAVSPLAVLGRGYSILTSAKGEVISSNLDTMIGEEITGRLKEGIIKVKVIETKHES